MKVLIGYDGSESSNAVFHDIRKAGLPRNAEAVVASIGDLLMNVPSSEDPVLDAITSIRIEKRLEKARAHADRIISEAEQFANEGKILLTEMFPDWKIESRVFSGTPEWILLDTANKLASDLIIVGSKGRSGISRIFLGSVAKKLATDAHCSVRVVRTVASKTNNSPPRILIGVDGSPAAEEAVYAVGHRVWPDGTEVRLVSVDESTPPITLSVRLPQAAHMINSYYRSKTERVESVLDWAVKEFSNFGIEATVANEKGDPKDIILSEAERWQADCIFVGTRDLKSAFERFRLGSVSTAIVTHAACTVEVVRPLEA